MVVCLLSLMGGEARASTLPAGFFEATVNGPAGGWNEPVGMQFEDNGRMYVWEKGGRVWFQEYGASTWTLLIDISEEVGGWRDFGMLGFALDPNFRVNGYIYLMYVVDRHHLMNFGTPSYNPSSDEYLAATIGRITRYTARAADGFTSVDYATRHILLGESKTNGFPILYESHGVGSLVFGTDGTLLASCGDGASYSSRDIGSASETYYSQALTDGIIKPKENVGAYRAQLVDSLNGKVLRLDPAAGDGIPGNPFYDPANPRAAKSRVWALGLRNPCRMTLRPGTGSLNRADADPGVIYIGDVGYQTWEDLQICTGPGQNFGWPAFEGVDAHSGYYGSNVQNLDAPNPLYPGGGCSQYFYFNNLIKQNTTNAASKPPFNNPCNAAQKIPATIPQFLHTPPALDWKHGTTQARTWIYNGSGVAVAINVGAAGSPVSGSMFRGNCSIGGVWYTGNDFPATNKNTYFHADYGEGWIKRFVFDTNDKPVSVTGFLTGGGGVVAVATHPIDGGLYYIDINSSTVKKISYGGNLPPMALATANTNYGPDPLTVQFTGTGSTDPEGLPLTYDWNFGDGTAHSSAANPSHTFNAPGGVPTPFTVTLTVTDSVGQTSTATLLISVNSITGGISGVVRDQANLEPIAGAFVTLQASGIRTTTALDGRYSLSISNGTGLVIVAARKGYYNKSTITNAPSDGVEILLETVPQDQNANYQFQSPLTCANCHPDQHLQWENTAMANAGVNTWVHDTYSGKGTAGGTNGFVYLRDSVFAASNPSSECASCHQPESWIKNPFSPMQDPTLPPTEAVLHGISCEVCHKVASVDVQKINFPGIFPGAVDFTLPNTNTHQVEYGVLGDAAFQSSGMRPSYQPQLVAEVCGSCHQDATDVLENHSYSGPISEPTYLEWLDSPYSNLNSPSYASCVDCHMPPSGADTVCDYRPILRNPNTIRSHTIEGTTPYFLEHAVTLAMETEIVGNSVRVRVGVTNSQTGHHVPTGVTIRNMILLVEAWREEDGLSLLHTGPQTIHTLGGVGAPAQGYYAGLPGKLYAKVSRDAQGNGAVFFTEATGIQFDNRIPALGSDSTSYTFASLPGGGTVHTRARLIYRRAFRPLVDAKAWTQDGHGKPLEDILPPHFGHLMESAEQTIFLASTIGNTNEGTLTDLMGASWINAGRFPAGTSLTVTGMVAKVGAITGKYKCAIYGDSSGQPGRLLRSSAEVTNPATGWRSFPLTSPLALTNGQFYWLAIWSDNANANIYHSDTAGTIRWGNYAYGNWPDPIATTDGASLNYCLFAASAAPALTSITVTPTNTAILTGGTQQFTATGNYSDSSAQNITGQVAWTSSIPAIATISAGGLAAEVSIGSTTISATLAGVTGSTTLTCLPVRPEILSIGVTNETVTISWRAIADRSYVLEYADGLGATNWVRLPAILATGSATVATNAIGGFTQRFYRVVLAY